MQECLHSALHCGSHTKHLWLHVDSVSHNCIIKMNKYKKKKFDKGSKNKKQGNKELN